MLKALVLMLGVTLSTEAWACMFDLDCAIGSKCLKRSGSLEGICAGGMNPGNNYDQNPTRGWLNPKEGNTCTSNFDCGIGGTCLKSGLYGVCLR